MNPPSGSDRSEARSCYRDCGVATTQIKRSGTPEWCCVRHALATPGLKQSQLHGLGRIHCLFDAQPDAADVDRLETVELAIANGCAAAQHLPARAYRCF